MALSAKLQLRQAQSPAMTPQLMQSIRLLRMTRGELERFIDEQMEKNPLLARDETADETLGTAERRTSRNDGPESSIANRPAAAGALSTESETDSGDIADKLDTSPENVFPDDPGNGEVLTPNFQVQWKSAPAVGRAAGDFSPEAVAEAQKTLRQHVGEQIALAIRDPVDLIIAGELADMLDESGYMHADMGEIAARLGVGAERPPEVLKQCQSFEPPGLFARDLNECLAIQLRERDRFDPAMEKLIDNLHLLAKRDFAMLRKLCGVDEEDLVDMLTEIKALDPKPGTAFSVAPAPGIVPDVSVFAASDGGWIVELNADALPRVLVDHQYLNRVSGSVSGKDREFLTNCLREANWLTRSLDRRAETILKVASEIVRRQDSFLVHGISSLKPLTLKAVADEIGMHESTVSRVTANKFMATSRGVFELRYFFSRAIAARDDGDAHSSSAVRHRIRELIEGEPPEKALSDDAIVDILKKSDIDIARRTIAKYREAMHIPSSVQRRREKKAIAAANR